MNGLSNKYCVLKKSFNCALKKKDIPIPFFSRKHSQTDYEICTAVKRSSIPPYVNRKRTYTTPLANAPEVANAANAPPSWVQREEGKNLYMTPLLRKSVLPQIVYASRDTAFRKDFVRSLYTGNSRRPSIKNPPPLLCIAVLLLCCCCAPHSNAQQLPTGTATAQQSCMALCTRLSFLKCTEVKTCFQQFNSLAKNDEYDYSCSQSRNTKKDCMVVRPLLDFSRGIITAVCKYEKLPVYPDRSNQSLNYSRNRIRKQIIPGIQLFFNPQVEDALFQFAELVLHEQKLVSRVIHTAIRYRNSKG